MKLELRDLDVRFGDLAGDKVGRFADELPKLSCCLLRWEMDKSLDPISEVRRRDRHLGGEVTGVLQLEPCEIEAVDRRQNAE